MSSAFPITPDARYRIYTGTANQKVFTVDFPFLDATEIAVTKYALNGLPTLLSRPANYSLTGGGSPTGGTLTLKVGTVAGEKILIAGQVSRTRASSVTRDGRFSSVATDRDLDRLTLLAQEQDRELARVPKVAYGAAGPALTIGTAGTVPKWDAEGNLIEGPDSAALEAIEAALGVEAGRALVYPPSPADPVYDAGGRTIGNVADGIASTDAVTRGQLDALEAEFGLDGLAETLASLQAQIDLINAPGKLGLVFDTEAPEGWLKLNGQTIGDESSDATARAAADTENLFTHLWNKFDNTLLTIQDRDGAATTRGASAALDFAAHKRLPLPEVRGEFIRALDDGRGIDADRVLGSAQGDLVKQHTHTATFSGTPLGAHDHDFYITHNSGSGIAITGANSAAFTAKTSAVSAGTPAGTVSVANTGGAENRPRNIALLAIIKL